MTKKKREGVLREMNKIAANSKLTEEDAIAIGKTIKKSIAKDLKT